MRSQRSQDMRFQGMSPLGTRWQDATAPPFGPARGSQPGAQAGRHALKGQRNVSNSCCKSTTSENPTLNPHRAHNPLLNRNPNLNLYLFLRFPLDMVPRVVGTLGLIRRDVKLCPSCKGLLPISPYEYGTIWH
jgi:hypothetical protein